MILAKRLRAAREASGMSQGFVAEKLGVSRQAVGQWESGQSSPKPETLAALADLYGVSVDELLGRTTRPRHIRRADPIPPPGWDKLTDEEKKEVEEQTRLFEEFVVRRILREKGRV